MSAPFPSVNDVMTMAGKIKPPPSKEITRVHGIQILMSVALLFGQAFISYGVSEVKAMIEKVSVLEKRQEMLEKTLHEIQAVLQRNKIVIHGTNDDTISTAVYAK